MLTISSLVLSTALFLAMLMNVALKPKFSKNITAVCMIIGLIGGLIFYGIGFAEAHEVEGISNGCCRRCTSGYGAVVWSPKTMFD